MLTLLTEIIIPGKIGMSSMKNNQLNSSISNYYTTGDNDSMLTISEDDRNRASHSNKTNRNSNSLFYKFLKISSIMLDYIFCNAIHIVVSVFLITVLIGCIFYSKNIPSAIGILLLLIADFIHFRNTSHITLSNLSNMSMINDLLDRIDKDNE